MKSSTLPVRAIRRYWPAAQLHEHHLGARDQLEIVAHLLGHGDLTLARHRRGSHERFLSPGFHLTPSNEVRTRGILEVALFCIDRRTHVRTANGLDAHDRQDGSGCRGRGRRHPRRLDRHDRRVRAGRSAGRAHRRPHRAGRGRPHDRQQQRGQRRHRARRAARAQARAPDHLLVPAAARLVGVRRPLPGRRDRARDRAAGQPRRAHPRRRCRASAAFFSPTGVGTLLAEGKELAPDRRPRLRARVPDQGGLRARERAAGRPVGQPRLPQDRAQLRPDHGVRRDDHDRPGRRDRAARRARSGGDRHAGHLRRPRRRGGRAPVAARRRVRRRRRSRGSRRSTQRRRHPREESHR